MNNSVRTLAIKDIISSNLYPIHIQRIGKKDIDVWTHSPSDLIKPIHTKLNRLLGLHSVNHLGNDRGFKNK